jgi:hypothetical protein
VPDGRHGVNTRETGPEFASPLGQDPGAAAPRPAPALALDPGSSGGIPESSDLETLFEPVPL